MRKGVNKHWLALKANYADTTIEFVDYLFVVTSKNRNQINNASDITKLAKDIAKSDVFNDIVNKINSI